MRSIPCKSHAIEICLNFASKNWHLALDAGLDRPALLDRGDEAALARVLVLREEAHPAPQLRLPVPQDLQAVQQQPQSSGRCHGAQEQATRRTFSK